MKVGILGGGQLARMLIQDGQRLGLEMHVLATQLSDPAAQVCPHTGVGQLDHSEDLKSFFTGLDTVTVESEFLNTSVLRDTLSTLPLHPKPEILENLQDRLTQKQMLKKFGIPTAPFVACNTELNLSELNRQFKSGFVIKKRRFGYDGYGTFIFNKGRRPQIPKDPFGYIAEELIPFRRELALSIARNADGDFAIFPLVETKQVNSRCLWVRGPMRHPGVPRLLTKFKKMMNAIKYQGILAVELFDAKSGLIVNELAPRVHNSAHYSMDALSFSQFEAHLRGLLNWPLKNPEPLCKAFAMINLLGEKPKTPMRFSSIPIEFGRMHWYGKKENRVGRKMGHLNTFGKTPNEALQRALKWRKGFQL